MSTTTAPAHIAGLDRLYVSADPAVFSGLEVAHADETCPNAAPGGEYAPTADADGWRCTTCIDVSRRGSLTHGTVPQDSVDPIERGDGTGSGRPAPADGASSRQLEFVERLIAEKGDAAKALRATFPDQLTAGRNGTASALIDALMALAKPAADDGFYSWTKVDGQWMVTGPLTVEGAHIRIRKASGEIADAVVTHDGGLCKGRYLYQVRKIEAAGAAPAKAAGLRPTMFALRDRIVEVTGAQTKDRSIRVCVPASVLGVEDQPDAAYRISWSYDWKGAERHTGGVGSIRTIDLGDAAAVKLAEFLIAASPEDLKGYQAAYGQHFHSCGRCGSPLSDKDSKARGLGPDCAKLG